MDQHIKFRWKKLQQQLDALQKNMGELDHPSEVSRLLHDTQVYQIELELQNQELQASQQDLLEAHERYVDLYDFAPVSYFSFDRHGRVQAMNITATSLLGCERSKVIGQVFTAWLEKNSNRMFLRHLQTVFKDPHKQSIELRIKARHGEVRDIRLESIVIAPGSDKKDDHRGFCLTAMIDITEQKKAQAIADENQRSYRSLFENSPLSLWEMDLSKLKRYKEKLINKKGSDFDALIREHPAIKKQCLNLFQVNRVNQATFKLFQTLDHESFQRSLPRLFNEEGLLIMLFHWIARLESETVIDFESTAQTHRGGKLDLILHVNAALGHEADLKKVIVAITDVTGFRKVERELQQIRNDLEQRILERTASLAQANQMLRQEGEERQQAQSSLAHLAHHDPLTKLPNRLLFQARLEQSIQHARRHKQNLALFFLDLDRFKTINDSMGHAYGDKLLIEVAERINKCVRSEDTVARMGGDEFTVLMSEVSHPEDAAVLAKKILQEVTQPIVIDGSTVVTTASIGIGTYPADACNSEDLVKAADVAMYRAKERGRNAYEFYTPELSTRAMEHALVEQGIRDTLSNEQFMLYYQPQMELSNGRICGVEALLRGQHPNFLFSNPQKVILIAETSELITKIDHWSLRKACEQAARWRDMGFSGFRVAVNLSARNFMRNNITQTVKSVLQEFNLDPAFIELEVTESVLQTTPTIILELKALKELGVILAIDDFGTGYSCLASLKQLPIDRLKIDKSFIANLPDDQDDVSITRAIIALGHNLNLKVIAEGVETEAQWSFLREAGCDEVQGFWLGKPKSARAIQSMLEKAHA